MSRVGHGVHRAAHRAARAAIQGPVLGSVARVSKWGSRPCNMSVGVPNVHVKVYNMLIPHNNPNVCAVQHACLRY